MTSKLCLVTGGAGCIGSHVAQGLLDQGFKVRILDDLSTGFMENIQSLTQKVEFVKGDIKKDSDISKAIRNVSYVFHLAANRAVLRSVDKPLETNDINVTGTLKLLIAAQKNKVKRFIFSSSSSVYGETKKFPLSEDDLPKPESPYAASKIMGEYYCKLFTKLYGLETVSLRYFNVYGPRQNPESIYSAVIPIFLEKLIQEQPPEIHWDGKQSRDFVYASDIAQANILAMKSAKAVGEVFNIASGEELSVNELFKEIQRLTNKKHVKPVYKPKRNGDVRRTAASIKKARALLGYQPKISFRKGIEKTIHWFLDKYKL